VRGRARQKLSPASIHAYVQTSLARIVGDWAKSRDAGAVGSEWRVRILPAGSNERRPLTPDVAFFSNERLATISRRASKDVQFPPLAPDIAFEVISESDERADVEAKRRDYLLAGSVRVVEIYPEHRMLRAWSSAADSDVVDARGTYTDSSFPGLEIRVADLFASYDEFLAKLGD